MARKTPLSEADKAAARRLKRLAADIRTEDMIARYGETTRGRPLSKSMLSQYLNGHTKIGPLACMKFAAAIGCAPSDIRPDFSSMPVLPSDLPEDVMRMALDIAMFNHAIREDIDAMIQELKRSGVSYLRYLREIPAKNTIKNRD